MKKYKSGFKFLFVEFFQLQTVVQAFFAILCISFMFRCSRFVLGIKFSAKLLKLDYSLQTVSGRLPFINKQLVPKRPEECVNQQRETGKPHDH